MKYFIDSIPARDVVRVVMSTHPELSSLEVSQLIEKTYDEDFFYQKTSSLTKNDYILYHMCRSVKNQLDT